MFFQMTTLAQLATLILIIGISTAPGTFAGRRLGNRPGSYRELIDVRASMDAPPAATGP